MATELRRQRWWVAAGAFAGLVWTIAKIVIPLLAAAAIDDGMNKGDSGAIVKYAVLIVAVGAVQAVGTGLRRYAAFGLAWRVETDIRMRLVAHLQRLHFAFHDQAQTGQLMALREHRHPADQQRRAADPARRSRASILAGGGRR